MSKLPSGSSALACKRKKALGEYSSWLCRSLICFQIQSYLPQLKKWPYRIICLAGQIPVAEGAGTTAHRRFQTQCQAQQTDRGSPNSDDTEASKWTDERAMRGRAGIPRGRSRKLVWLSSKHGLKWPNHQLTNRTIPRPQYSFYLHAKKMNIALHPFSLKSRS